MRVGCGICVCGVPQGSNTRTNILYLDNDLDLKNGSQFISYYQSKLTIYYELFIFLLNQVSGYVVRVYYTNGPIIMTIKNSWLLKQINI